MGGLEQNALLKSGQNCDGFTHEERYACILTRCLLMLVPSHKHDVLALLTCLTLLHFYDRSLGVQCKACCQVPLKSNADVDLLS